MSRGRTTIPTPNVPYEVTLELNLVHELMVEFERAGVDDVAVFSPPRGTGPLSTIPSEAELGYDVGMGWDHNIVKLLALQFKRPETADHNDDESHRRYGNLVSFDLRESDNSARSQYETLLDTFPGPNVAFYALPVVMDRDYLPGMLHNTVFVDIQDVRDALRRASSVEPRRIYIETTELDGGESVGWDGVPQTVEKEMIAPVTNQGIWWHNAAGSATAYVWDDGAPQGHAVHPATSPHGQELRNTRDGTQIVERPSDCNLGMTPGQFQEFKEDALGHTGTYVFALGMDNPDTVEISHSKSN